MSDRRMQALQILNTLCTLPLEKMNTFLLTCLYLSFTLYTRIPYIPNPHPQPSATTYPCNARRRGLLQISFYNINCISLSNPQLNFQHLQSDSTICVTQITRCDSVKGYSCSYTLCREIKHPNAAVHCL